MKVYENTTSEGLYLQVSYFDGVCFILIHDTYDCETTLRFFDNVDKAIDFVRSF